MKKLLALVLSILILASVFPLGALAEEEALPAGTEAEEKVEEEALPEVVPEEQPVENDAEEVQEKEAEEPEAEEEPSLMMAGLMLIPEADLDELTVFVAKDSENGLDGDVAVVLDDNAGTVYLPGSANIEALSLSWTPAAGITVKVEGYEDGEAPLPAAGGSLTYLFSNGKDQREITLTTIQGSESVAGMFITIDETMGTIAAMNSDPSHETSCYGKMGFEENEYFMSMKGRGNWTWRQGGDKKPYNVTLYKKADYDKKQKAELIEGVEAKKWTILSNSTDTSLLRNRLGLYMANELGVGLDTRFVDVWLNGEYFGNYLLTPKNDYQVPDEGFMVEIDNNSDVDQFTLNGSPNFTVKEKPDDISVNDVKNAVSPAWDAVRDANSDSYLNYFDLDSWAKMYLLNEFYKDNDVSAGSIFFTKASMDKGDKLVAGPAWDMDVSLGRTNTSWVNMDRSKENSGDGWYIDLINGTNIFQLLGKHKSFMMRVYELYNEYKSVFDSAEMFLEQEIEALRDSADMNFTVWDAGSTIAAEYLDSDKSFGSGKYAVHYVATSEWGDFVYNLQEYVSKRLAFLSDNLTFVKPVGILSGETSYIVGETVSLAAELSAGNAQSYKWQSSADGVQWTDIPGAASATFRTSALKDTDGMSFRCVVSGGLGPIQTQRVAKVGLTAESVLGPVTVSTTMEGHQHGAASSVVTKPTCTEGGYTTFTCACGETYTGDYTDPTGHNYGQPSFSWNGYNCTASVRCSCGDTQYPECTVTSAVTKNATSLTTGVRTYTARVTVNGRTYTSTKTETIPRTGGGSSGGGSSSILGRLLGGIGSIVSSITSVFSSIFRW